MVGHWPGEEQGLIGSHSFAYDHPEIVRAIYAGFNQDNGTGRIQHYLRGWTSRWRTAHPGLVGQAAPRNSNRRSDSAASEHRRLAEPTTLHSTVTVRRCLGSARRTGTTGRTRITRIATASDKIVFDDLKAEMRRSSQCSRIWRPKTRTAMGRERVDPQCRRRPGRRWSRCADWSRGSIECGDGGCGRWWPCCRRRQVVATTLKAKAGEQPARKAPALYQ